MCSKTKRLARVAGHVAGCHYGRVEKRNSYGLFLPSETRDEHLHLLAYLRDACSQARAYVLPNGLHSRVTNEIVQNCIGALNNKLCIPPKVLQNLNCLCFLQRCTPSAREFECYLAHDEMDNLPGESSKVGFARITVLVPKIGVIAVPKGRRPGALLGSGQEMKTHRLRYLSQCAWTAYCPDCGNFFHLLSIYRTFSRRSLVARGRFLRTTSSSMRCIGTGENS